MQVYCAGATGCSWNGQNFEPDENGAFDVPEEALAALAAHGFTTVPPAPDAVKTVTVTVDVPLTGNPAKWTKDVLTAEAARLGLDLTLDRPALVREVAAARKAEADAAYTEAEAE